MTPTDIAKAKKIRIGLIILSTLFLVGAGFSLFLPATSPLWVRCVSAVPCLIAAVLWFLPVIPNLSTATFLKTLVIANFLLLAADMHVHNKLEFAKWKTIYLKVGETEKTTSFDYGQFGSFLSDALRQDTGWRMGLNAVWILNGFVLLVVAGYEHQKTKNQDRLPSETSGESPTKG